MGCCKCESLFSGWSDPQPVVYKDDQGKDYCVYHASASCKFKSLDGERYTVGEFNGLIFERIRDARNSKVSVEKVSCNLRGTIFPGDISFCAYDKLNPLPDVYFSHAEFCGKVDFKEVCFGGVTSFTDAHFFHDVNFHKAKFVNDVRFMKTEFECRVDFAWVVYSSIVSYFEVTFMNKANFESCQARDGAIRFLGLKRKSIQNLVCSSFDVRLFSFLGCHWPSRLSLDDHDGMDALNRMVTAEELYRAMKQRAAEGHDQPQVSHWHFREKLMQLKQLLNNKRSNDLLEEFEDSEKSLGARAWAWGKLLALPPYGPKFTLTGLYWASSGFGERAVRAGVVLLTLVAGSFALNSLPQPLDWNALPGSAAANATLATIPFAKDIPGDGWVKVGRGFWQFLVAAQFTLFALAVRNRFRR